MLIVVPQNKVGHGVSIEILNDNNVKFDIIYKNGKQFTSPRYSGYIIPPELDQNEYIKNIKERAKHKHTDCYEKDYSKGILKIVDAYVDYGQKSNVVPWSIYTKDNICVYYQYNRRIRIPEMANENINYVDSLCTCGLAFYPNEFGHYPCESIPKIIRLMENETVSSQNVPILVSEKMHKFLTQIERYANRNYIIHIPHNKTTFFAKELYFTNYFISKSDFLLAQKIFNESVHKKKSDKQCTTILIIDRSDANKRRVLNSTELVSSIQSTFSQDNIEVVSFVAQKHTLKETMEMFYNADVVLAPHGAGLSNILFCRPEIQIIEYISKETGSNCFEYYANLLNLKWTGIYVLKGNWCEDYTVSIPETVKLLKSTITTLINEK